MDMKATGAFLRERRTEKNLTQADVAERLGLSPQSVSNWERGESLPDASILMDVALMYETSVDLILGSLTRVEVPRRAAVELLERAGKILDIRYPAVQDAVAHPFARIPVEVPNIERGDGGACGKIRPSVHAGNERRKAPHLGSVIEFHSRTSLNSRTRPFTPCS